MVDREEDCAEILTQLAAVRSAINNAGKVILMDHLNHCIVEAVEENDMEKNQRIRRCHSEICKVSIMIVNVEKKRFNAASRRRRNGAVV